MKSPLKDKILLLKGCGMEPYEIAEFLECRIANVRAIINAEKRKMREREAKKILEATTPLEMR